MAKDLVPQRDLGEHRPDIPGDLNKELKHFPIGLEVIVSQPVVIAMTLIFAIVLLLLLSC